MPAPPVRGNLHVHFDCVELRFVVYCESQLQCKFNNCLCFINPLASPALLGEQQAFLLLLSRTKQKAN